MTQTKYLQRSISILALMLFCISTTSAHSVVANIRFAQGVANSFDSKLQNALATLESLNNGNVGTVCNKLDSFINEVEAKNELTSAQATDLINAANRIKRTLGCDG